MDMLNCSSCEGFVPAQARRCPHCDASVAQRGALRKLLNVAGGGAVAMTLMACYGGPMAEPPPPQAPSSAAPTCSDATKDIDGDGYCEADCDEMNREIYPGAPDAAGDGIDQNCDGADGIKSDTVAQ